MRRLIRSLLAAALLAVLVIGVPVILVKIAGWPLPRSVPDWDNVITMLRQGNVPSDAVYKTIAVVVWFAWAQMMIAVVWEAAVNIPRVSSGRASRPAPLVISPVSTGVARVFAIILASTVIATANPAGALPSLLSDAALPAPSVTYTVGHSSAAQQERPDDTTSPDDRDVDEADLVWVVQTDDTLWDIAEQTLGDGSLVEQILKSNPTVTSRNLRPGIRVVLPAGATLPADRQDVPAEAHSDVPHVAPIVDAVDAVNDVVTYTVQANDGLWNVAEALLGDGSRHVEMHDMLIGQEVAPGVFFDADTFVIHEGWTFTAAPARVDDGAIGDGGIDDVHGVDVVHVVERGDTLSDIAAEHLGDANQWPAIFDANSGSDMGDGRSFDDPDLILPGWEIDMPTEDSPNSDATAVQPSVPPVLEVEEVERPEAPPVTTPIAPPVTTPILQTVSGQLPPPVLPAPETTGPTTSSPMLGSNFVEGGVESGERPSPTAPSPVRLEHAALLAAGLLTLVGVRRRQRLRTSKPRARVPQPPANVVATERRLRTIDVGERAARIDIAIRATAHALTDLDVQVVVVTASVDGLVTVHLTGPANLPSPWVGQGCAWRLDASVPIEMLSDTARRVNTPIVALVQIGVADDGSDVLIDIEACGTLAVEARPGQADEVITAIAAGLATSPYAEAAHLIGVATPPTALLGHRNAFHVGSIEQGFDLAMSLVGSTVNKTQSTFALRSLHTSGEMWEPAIIMAASSIRSDFLTDRSDLPQPGHGLALVASVSPGMVGSACGRLVAGTDGWSLTAFGSTTALTPIGLSRDELSDISDVLLDADSPLVESAGPVGADDSPTLVDASDVISQEFVPLNHTIVVRLLGAIEVRSVDGTIGKFERSKTVELIAWLATHREKSTRSAARTALWELDVRDATFANVVSEARRSLARLTPPPESEEWVERTLTDQLPLHELVVTDVQLIQQRLDAARLQPPNEAIATLRPAAEMIVDLPFAGTNYLWPDAEGITSNLVLLATSVTAELAAHALSIGDTDLVFWATGQGLAVLPGHEELIGLRMQAYARSGDLAGVRQEWDTYERIIAADAWSDGEPAQKLLDLRRDLLASR